MSQNPWRRPTLYFIALMLLFSGCKSFSRSSVAGNHAVMEGLVVEQMRTIYRAEKIYKGETGGYGSIEELIDRGQLNRDPSGHLSYNFRLNAERGSFQCVATPTTYGTTGVLSFFVDDTGAVKGADHGGKPATDSDPIINN